MQKVFQINDLFVDSHFKDFLIANQNKCCRMILCLDTNGKYNYIAPSDKEDMITYLPNNKQDKALSSGIDPFSQEAGRSRMKVGRLITKIFSEEMIKEFNITNSDVEEFVNSYKSFFSLDNIEIKVIEGEEIKKWYLDHNYLQPNGSLVGPLWKSCMRHRLKQPLLDIYCKNPDKVKLLVMLQKDVDGQDKLRARALLWQDTRLSSSSTPIKVMDRIYTIFDSDIFIFKDWARNNGYISKYYQNSKSFPLFDVDGSETVLLLSTKLEKHVFELYPYLDTFQFYNVSEGEFLNYPSRYDYQLNHSDGFLHNDDEEESEPDFGPEIEPEDEDYQEFDGF